MKKMMKKMVERVGDFWNAHCFDIMFAYQVGILIVMIVAIATGKVTIVR